MVERRGTAREGALLLIQFREEGDIANSVSVCKLQFVQRGHQALGDEASAEIAVASALVGVDAMVIGGVGWRTFCTLGLLRHRELLVSSVAAACAAVTKARIFSGSLALLVSTPLLTSTPRGCTVAIASATFSGVRPPERMIGQRCAARRARSQSPVTPAPP